MKGNYEEIIDRTLRAIASAEPAEGIEKRIAARLAQASEEKERFFRIPQLVFNMAIATTACAVIVVASISHSHHMLPEAPGLQVPGITQTGLGAASGTRVASHPVTALPHDRPRYVREETSSGAVISRKAKKRAGIAVPKVLPPEQQAR